MARTRVPPTKIPGAGTIYDYRGTDLLPPNGGKTPKTVMVEHIPVVPNMAGTQDFELLARVLKAQGLSLQAATDSAGNVALYNDLGTLCFQARGLNTASCGVEHMHATITEPWTTKQLRASAWLWVRAKVAHGIPYERARLGSGPGFARVLSKGHATHAAVSAAAGFHDRSDPGPGYSFPEVRRLARYYEEHGTFKGADDHR
jgi:hypothetical protein